MHMGSSGDRTQAGGVVQSKKFKVRSSRFKVMPAREKTPGFVGELNFPCVIQSTSNVYDWVLATEGELYL